MASTDSIGNEAKGLVDLVVAYARQETVDPIKALGKNVAFGILGAVLVGSGSVFLGLAILRALQTQTDAFDGNLTWVPYMILTVVLAVAAVVSWKGMGPGRAKGGSTT